MVAVFSALSIFPSLAAGEGGLVVVALLSPPDQGPNEPIGIDVEVYRWGARVDADEVLAQTSGGLIVKLERLSTGAYHGDFTLTPDPGRAANQLTVVVTARVGPLSASASPAYVIRLGWLSYYGGSAVVLRILGLDQQGPLPAPGTTVNIEARTYREGVLQDMDGVSGAYLTTVPE